MERYHLLNYCREEGQGRMIYKHILGVVHFKATGDNTIKFVNAIRKANFICKNLKVKTMKFLVRYMAITIQLYVK